MDHDGSPPPHGRHDVPVVAHIRGAPIAPALVVGVHDPHRRAVNRPVDEGGLAVAGKPGDGDDGVVRIGEAHAIESGSAGSAARQAAVSAG
jgi:hypothetical protein